MRSPCWINSESRTKFGWFRLIALRMRCLNTQRAPNREGFAASLPAQAERRTCPGCWRIPVLGVPVQSHAMQGLDSLYSIVQMPAGIPVATFAIGRAGAINAALYAAAMLALSDSALAGRLDAYRKNQTASVLAHLDPREG